MEKWFPTEVQLPSSYYVGLRVSGLEQLHHHCHPCCHVPCVLAHVSEGQQRVTACCTGDVSEIFTGMGWSLHLEDGENKDFRNVNNTPPLHGNIVKA
jgi:hypothetical protein